MPSRLEQSFTLPSSGAPALVADLNSHLAVIVTHPWGPLGGNLHANVVSAAVLYFQKLQITTLRFDFVGSQIGRGNYQVEQVKEAARFLLGGKHIISGNITKTTTAPSYILLVGYSYGALIASSASADIPQCVGCVSVSPPFAVMHWLLLFHSKHHLQQARKRTSLPRLMVIGTNDNFTSEDKFRDMVDSFPAESTTGAVLKGADHFYARREKDLMDIIGQWLLSTYPACRGDLGCLGQVHLVGYQEPTTTTTRGVGSEDKGASATGAAASAAQSLGCAAALAATGCLQR